MGHEQAFHHFGSVPETVVVDNAKPVVLQHTRAAVIFHPTYVDFAGHVVIEPAHYMGLLQPSTLRPAPAPPRFDLDFPAASLGNDPASAMVTVRDLAVSTAIAEGECGQSGVVPEVTP
jgi:hypothetical protein